MGEAVGGVSGGARCVRYDTRTVRTCVSGHGTAAGAKPGRRPAILTVRHRTRLAAYAAHPERFVQGPPCPETLPTAVWINRPPKPTREEAPGATPVTPDDPQHGVIRRSQPIRDDRPITLVTSVGLLQ